MIAILKPYPHYRDSGLPWLGQIPVAWGILRGKSIFCAVDERSKTGREELLTVSAAKGVTPRSEMTVTMFKAKSYIGYKLCWPGDLVVNSLWAWGRGLGVSRYHGITSTAYGVYRLRSGYVDYAAFIHELVRSTPFNWELRVRSKGIWISRLQLTDESFLDAPFPLPPLDEQSTIVRFLDHANGLIERAIRAKKKLIALLIEQKQAIIHRAVTRGLDATAPFKSSGIASLGHIPAHWEVLRLKNVLERPLANGLFKKKHFFGSGVPLVNVADIYSPGAEIVIEKLGRVQATQEEIATFQVLPGDIFFVRSSLKLEGTGRSAFIAKCQESTVFECHVVRARPISKKLISRYLALFLNSWWAANYLISRANTVTMSTLPQGSINSTPILVPPVPEQHDILGEIDSETSPLNQAVVRAEREITLLREYRTRLVADVVTGKLDVREAAKNLPVEPEESAIGAEPEDQGTTLDEEYAN